MIKPVYVDEVGAESKYPISFLYKKDSENKFRLKYVLFCTECHVIQCLDASKNLLGKIPSGFYMP